MWYDRKFVHFISTMHCSTLNKDLPIVMRKNKDGSREAIQCPPLPAIHEGVDQGDQMIGYYNIGRRSMKWWKRCFAYLVECALLNAFILNSITFPSLYRRRGCSKRDFLAFCLDVAKQLIGGFQSRQRSAG